MLASTESRRSVLHRNKHKNGESVVRVLLQARARANQRVGNQRPALGECFLAALGYPRATKQFAKT